MDKIVLKEGDRIRILPSGFDESRVGVVARDALGLYVNTDPLDILPSDHPWRRTELPKMGGFELIP